MAGVAAKATYRTMAILSRGEALEGDDAARAPVGDALVVRLDPQKEHGEGRRRETKAERRHARRRC